MPSLPRTCGKTHGAEQNGVGLLARGENRVWQRHTRFKVMLRTRAVTRQAKPPPDTLFHGGQHLFGTSHHLVADPVAGKNRDVVIVGGFIENLECRCARKADSTPVSQCAAIHISNDWLEMRFQKLARASRIAGPDRRQDCRVLPG